MAAITFDHLGTPEQMAALLATVERHGAPATFFVTGERAAADPDGVKSLLDAGYEVGMHGWAHEMWCDLDPGTERALATRATNAITEATGERPRGFRAPGGSRSAATVEILSDLGYDYDASLGDGMRRARLSRSIAQVPFVWGGVDGAFYLEDPPAAPAAVLEAWSAALARTAPKPDGLFVTICHPEITGIDDGRLAVLDEIVARAVAEPNVELCTVAAIAARIPA
jgi:peptidoglycan/xylan/chitin deacetylase (PgdA/CDA1 family)